MKPPLIIMAHYAPTELTWCENCQRISNSTAECYSCGARCGLIGIGEMLVRKEKEKSPTIGSDGR